MLTDNQQTYLRTGRAELIKESAKLDDLKKQESAELNVNLSIIEELEHKKDIIDNRRRALDKDIRDKVRKAWIIKVGKGRKIYTGALSDLALIAKEFPIEQNEQIFCAESLQPFISAVLSPIKKNEEDVYIKDKRIFKMGLMLAELGINAAYKALSFDRLHQVLGAEANTDDLSSKCKIIKNAVMWLQ